jgi:hypothetical protein
LIQAFWRLSDEAFWVRLKGRVKSFLAGCVDLVGRSLILGGSIKLGPSAPPHARYSAPAVGTRPRYVIIDIFGRRIVAWCNADVESAALFKPLFDDAVVKHNIAPGQLTPNADRGGPMKAKAAALLVASLGVTK